ncbi:hypothetical protein B0H13DRAFT_1853621 [Mycena leptocephala]|nr:hypothetical protein B0H13DRAFT_1853621 [Mycena leptocephala]
MPYNELDLLLAQQKWREHRSQVQEFHEHSILTRELQEVSRELKRLYEKVEHLQTHFISPVRRNHKVWVIPIRKQGGGDEKPGASCGPSHAKELLLVRDGDERKMGKMSFPTSFIRND